ncbi:hypothetical protein FIBSPDRAFT_870453 [Athelia psychrophila]|uniref:Uncharacterized protein n=1 Tax=Athelia psychrophila TaxID=1759441 RepID=A0A165YCR1_9AGAM|nr:hypothetical protein FIBSPDRAFT_873592 [Fibularhizoctonia sp. CBS 109695]KZP12270.1 hypothetical protein FIBSPDRAFT_870453 [Fibularhizoctonia sp. CBS 109695]
MCEKLSQLSFTPFPLLISLRVVLFYYQTIDMGQDQAVSHLFWRQGGIAAVRISPSGQVVEL